MGTLPVGLRVKPTCLKALYPLLLRRLQIAVLIMFIALSLLGGSTVSPSPSGSSGGGCEGDSGCKASKVREKERERIKPN